MNLGVLGQLIKINTVAVSSTAGVVGNGLLNNLTAVWEMEEASAANRSDSSGNSHTLTNRGNVVQSSTSIQGSFSCMASTHTSRLDNGDSALLATTKFTGLVWFQASANLDTLWVIDRWNVDNVWALLGNGTTVSFVARKVDGSGNTSFATSTVNLDSSFNKWHLCVFGFDSVNNVNFISVDGETIVTATNSEGALRSGADLYTIFDVSGGSNGATVVMNVDETAIWENRVLTQSDITKIVGTYNFSSQTGTPLFFSSWTT